MPRIRDWLRERASGELFEFDRVDFEQDCDEILKEYAEADDPLKEEQNRNKLWRILSSWQRDKDYLSSLNLHRLIAKYVRISCRQARGEDTLEGWTKLGAPPLDGLADEIAAVVLGALQARPSRQYSEVTKFSDELSFDNLDAHDLGLEDVIGYPALNAEFLPSDGVHQIHV